MANNAPLFRGLSFNSKDNKRYKQLLENLDDGFFQTDAFNSTSTDRSAAEGFAMKKSFQVLVEFKKHNTAKDLKYLVGAFSDGYDAESEVMLLKKKKYKVIKKEQTVALNGLPLLKIDVEVMND